MKTIEITNRGLFQYYDGLVQKGEWSAHQSKKQKPDIRTDSLGRSYKVYDNNLHVVDRIGRVLAWALSCVILMPLWSKSMKSLLKEAWTGKEKIKVIAPFQPNEEPTDDRDLSKVVDAANSCITHLLSKNADSIAIFLTLQRNSQIIEKQFIFTSDKTDIEQRIEKYAREKLLGGESLSKASHYKCNILGIAQEGNNYFKCETSLSRTKRHESETWSEAESREVSAIVQIVRLWLQSHMPQVRGDGENDLFRKIEPIYQPV